MTPPAGDPRPDAPVVLCYDGSSESANAIERAAELLGPRRAIVAHAYTGLSSIMLHAPLAGSPSGAIAEGAKMFDEADREAGEECAAQGAQLAEAAGFDARPEAMKAKRNTWSTLRDCATRHDAAAIVAGARGQSRVASLLLGSVSGGLAHHARTPTLVVPAAASGPIEERPALYCYDGSDNARRAIAFGRALLRGPGRVVALWQSAAVMAVGAAAVVSMSREIDEGFERNAERDAAEGAELAGGDGDAVRFDGPTWRGLLDMADDVDAGVIVLGSRGASGIARALGSVSSALLNHAARAVLVVPPAADDGH